MTDNSTSSASKAKATATPGEQINDVLAENAQLVLKAGTEAARKSYDTAVAVTREPAAVALKTGGVAIKDYDAAVAFGRENIDVAAEVGTLAVRGLQTFGKEWIDQVQKSAEELPVAFKAFAACKTVKEAADLQVEYVKTGFDDMVNTAVRFQQLGYQLATATFEPLNKRFAETVTKYGKPFAA